MKPFIEAGLAAGRIATPRRYLMCPPAQFAFRQWQQIRHTLAGLGHSVEVIEPLLGVPDMVFAANGAVVRDGRALVARFRFEERAAEALAYLDWFTASGYETRQASWTSEGQGDFVTVGDWLLAGSGSGDDRRCHAETEEYFGCPVVALTLIDESCYHLDTVLAALDGRTIMYYPEAFSKGSQALLRELFPDAIVATRQDAVHFGLNAICDGSHVVLPAGATSLTAQLRDRGYRVIDLDIGELLRAGGGVKRCVLELCGSGIATGQPPVAAEGPGQSNAAITHAERRPTQTPAGLTVVVTSVASDSHTWNLVYLQLALEELGHKVVNLGACVPDELLIGECLRVRPDLVVVSTVNGHGFHDGMQLIGRLRAREDLATTPVVIGGKLGIAGPAGRAGRDQLRAAGFDAVYEEGDGIAALAAFAGRLRASIEA